MASGEEVADSRGSIPGLFYWFCLRRYEKLEERVASLESLSA